MMKKMYLFWFLLAALTLNVFSQDAMNKNAATTTKGISAEEASKTALNVGAKMPAFSLSDSAGKIVNSDDLLKQGNLVVVFYRGAWCPFCNLYLRKLQENISQIKAAGGNLVAISIENPDRSLAIAAKDKIDFTVLSDPNFTLARKFKIVYELPPETNELYKSKGLDLATYNSTEKPELPLSATYVVNKKGEIVYAFLEPDYKKRAEPSAIIEALSKIKTDKMNAKK
ncbi:MAG: peroxiredoxin-like family protein [Pyrinomonadaceae bacterium]